MIRVYFLPVENIDGTDKVTGSEFIHDALLDCTIDPMIRKLIMDTTQDEHDSLVVAGGIPATPSPEDLKRYATQVVITPPDPDLERARELLSTSPQVITQPEMWELMRIYGRKLFPHA